MNEDLMRYLLPLLLLFACQGKEKSNVLPQVPTDTSSVTAEATPDAIIETARDTPAEVEQVPPTPVYPRTNIPVIFDSDTNNEIDDQHALAYLLLNSNNFNVLGITVNATEHGGDITQHAAEAQRVIELCDKAAEGLVKLGANGDFSSIEAQLNEADFDGREAVQFIIETARQYDDHQLAVVAVGKLTNVALALKLAPDIEKSLRIIWLGSNYPAPGEYNLDNDIAALNFLLDTEVPFEMVTVRYDEATGATAVNVTPAEMASRMSGLGPRVEPAIPGRDGGSFHHFGDYSLHLFEQVELYGDPPSRSLFDVVALAIMKNPDWGKNYRLSAPIYVDGQWVDRPENQRLITIWENFQRAEILEDFFNSLQVTAVQ